MDSLFPVLATLETGNSVPHDSGMVIESISAAHRALRDRGVTFRSDPHLIAKMSDREVWMAFLLDTGGNTLALMTEILTP